jgi:hypothetical protein
MTHPWCTAARAAYGLLCARREQPRCGSTAKESDEFLSLCDIKCRVGDVSQINLPSYSATIGRRLSNWSERQGGCYGDKN